MNLLDCTTRFGHFQWQMMMIMIFTMEKTMINHGIVKRGKTPLSCSEPHNSGLARCIETAVEICRVFNCGLCIDRQLGDSSDVEDGPSGVEDLLPDPTGGGKCRCWHNIWGQSLSVTFSFFVAMLKSPETIAKKE